MDSITANSCRICLKPETNDVKFSLIEEVKFSRGVCAIDALNEMFVLRLTKTELSSNTPKKLCLKCQKSLEICVELWVLAWDAQWRIDEWKKDMTEDKEETDDDSSTYESPELDKIKIKSTLSLQTRQQMHEESLKQSAVIRKKMFAIGKNNNSSVVIPTKSLPAKKQKTQETPFKPMGIKIRIFKGNCVRYGYDEETTKKRSQIANYHRTVIPNAAGKFPCNKCHKAFDNREAIRSHLFHCYNVRPFKCQVCEKSFVKGSNLKNHVRTHTNIKLFECTVCGKKLSDRENLKKHLASHTRRQKAFKCTVCDSEFVHLKYCKAHILNCHKDMNVQDCWLQKTKNELKLERQRLNEALVKYKIKTNKSSVEKSKKLDEKQDSELNTFVCDICQKKFICKQNLIDHVVSHSKTQNEKAIESKLWKKMIEIDLTNTDEDSTDESSS